jgi:hypothetical protein
MLYGGDGGKVTTMRRSAIVTLVFATLASANQGHAEENRGSADYLLPLCKTWLDFAEKGVETVKDLGRTEPIRLTAAGMCAGFVVGRFFHAIETRHHG